MYAYNKKYTKTVSDFPDAWLLYPVNSDMRKYADDSIIEFISKNADENDVHVRLFFVDLKDISQSMRSLKTRLENNHLGLCEER